MLKLKQTDIGKIPEEWELKKIETISERVSVGYVGITSKHFTNSSDGIPLLRSQNIRNGKINFENLVYITKDFHYANKKSILQSGDVLVVRVGENRGDTCILKNEFKEVNCANIVFFRPKKEYGKFIELFLRSPIGQFILESLTTGSAQGVINTTSIAEIMVPIPSAKEAIEISTLIDSIENKIDLLHRQNKTLEELAETLFRQWFVEEAKESWQTKPLKDVCEIINGFAFKSDDYRDEGRMVIRTMNFDNGYLNTVDVIYISLEEEWKYLKHQLKRFDFLLVMVGASIGNFAIVTSDILPALQNQNMWNFRTFGKLPQHYLNFAIRAIIRNNMGSASGSAREFFQKGQFYEFLISIPNDEKLNEFNSITEKQYTKIENNRNQIRTLTELRDTLLPKLMTGEVRIK